MITILLLIWGMLVVPGFNYYDYLQTRKGGKPNYFLYFLIKGFLAIVHGICMLIVNQDSKTDYTTLSAWQLTVAWSPYVVFQITSFWIIYELIRNAWSKKQWDYYDRLEGDSGLIDRFSKWTGPTLHIVLKVLAFLVCVFSIFVIYYR